MKYDSDSLNRRRPLWLALSELFLDTELEDSELAMIADKIKASGYSLDEINGILMNEVFPVCISNLHTVAGEWAGFNQDWLLENITRLKSPNVFQRWSHRRNFWMIKDNWGRVVEKLKSDQAC